MDRRSLTPRTGWEQKVESVGLTYHHTISPAGAKHVYWDESACYRFSMAEVDVLERATNDLHQLCLAAAQHIIDHDRFSDLGIPKAAVPAIRAAWDAEPPAIYGRFDLAYDGVNPPKLLEYNADTPTALVEASVAQWYWLQDVLPGKDQFNSIHERLVAKWQELKLYLWDTTLSFGYADNPDTEDVMTIHYLRDTAEQAGLTTQAIRMADLGWHSGMRRFVDLENRPIGSIFKLYPWEWMLHEDFGANVLATLDVTQWIEPIWKMLLSNKGILPILWELNPGHPNLLEARFTDPGSMTQYVRKPKLSREGANVMMAGSNGVLMTPGQYGDEGYVYQALANLPVFNGRYPIVGSWVVDGEAAGVGIREGDGPITDNLSRFVPHFIEG